MSQTKASRASRNIPMHVQRAVNARDGDRCRICGVETEFLHYDHVFPFDLGGPTTVENVQRLCPKCNISKGNKIQCHGCRHWMSPSSPRCPQCGAKHPYSKHSQTLAGKLEDIFQRVGRAVVIGGAALVVLLLLAGGFYLYRYFSGPAGAAEQSAHVSTIVNSAFGVSKAQPASFQVVVPPGAANARVVGGYKVTSGGNAHFYILEQSQYQQWSAGAASFQRVAAREKSSSARLRQVLRPGTYHLLFAHNGGPTDSLTVAAEFYLKYD